MLSKKMMPLSGQRCLIGFFGLPRSLRYTCAHIRAHMYAPLEQAGFRLQKFAHFNCPALVHNPRTKEAHVPLDLSDAPLLALDGAEFEPQDDAHNPLMETLLSYPYPDVDDREDITRRNCARALYSMERLHALLSRRAAHDYGLICLLRADLDYLDRLPVFEIMQRLDEGSDLVVPGWQPWGGVNDRFAFCRSPAALRAYLQRGRYVQEFTRLHGHFHSERFLAYALEREGLRIGYTSMRAVRVRATGQRHHEWGVFEPPYYS